MNIEYKKALICFQNGKINEAEEICFKLVKKDTGNINFLLLLGVIYFKKKKILKSIEIFNKIIKQNPNHYQAFFNLGNVFLSVKEFNKSLECYNKAILINPEYKKAYNNRGNVMRELGMLNQAVKNYDKAIAIESNNPDLYVNRGTIFYELKNFSKASKDYIKAIHLKKNYAEAYFSLANVFNETGASKDAIENYKIAIRINPNYAEAYNNLGNLYNKLKKYNEAIICFEKAIRINPNFNFLYGNLILTKCIICDWKSFKKDIKNLEKNIKIKKKTAPPFLTLSLFDSPQIQKNASIIWCEDKFFKSKNIYFENKKINKKVRIGYYSADFGEHAMSYLLANLFELHDKSKFEIIAFSFENHLESKIGKRVSNAFNKFFDVSLKSDEEIVELSKNLNIEIAVDLMGFTKKNRFSIFHKRCSPIQVNYLGYPGTLGNANIDYIIADKIIIPKKNEKFYSEKIVYLPNTYQVNDSKKQISKKFLSKKEFGLPENSFVFCCFNQNYKINPKIFNIWMDLLLEVKNSTLWLIEDNEISIKNLKKEAEKKMVNQNRIIFAKRLPNEKHLARHKLADLFIDTFPYTAHTTGSDALWSGLPLVTLKGETFASRVASSLLNAVNLPELVTTSYEEYKELAIKLSLNPKILQTFKKKLEKNISEKPLFNTKLFVKNIESAFIQMHDRYYKGMPKENIYIK